MDGLGTPTVAALRAAGHDVDAARTLLAEARQAGIRHLVFMSSVGVDAIPLGYYRQKLAIEELVSASGVPHTILRATQFHTLVASLFRAQRMPPAGSPTSAGPSSAPAGAPSRNS